MEWSYGTAAVVVILLNALGTIVGLFVFFHVFGDRVRRWLR